jgi:putative thioredoxin
MIDVTDFDKQVLAESYTQPVLVDFWAPWCGPCRQLGPILERLATQEDAGFLLAKVNTDENPVPSAQYGIRSIPAVKLFVNGEVADEFLGALPEPQVRRWLENALPSETRRMVEDAAVLLEAGDRDGARALLEQALAASPANSAAAALLSRLIVLAEPGRAAELARAAASADASYYELSRAVQTVAALLSDESSAALPEDPAKPAYTEGLVSLGKGDVDAALGSFVRSVRLNRRFHDDAARKALLAVFAVLGQQDPLTRKHRRGLESALF